MQVLVNGICDECNQKYGFVAYVCRVSLCYTCLREIRESLQVAALGPNRSAEECELDGMRGLAELAGGEIQAEG